MKKQLLTLSAFVDSIYNEKKNKSLSSNGDLQNFYWDKCIDILEHNTFLKQPLTLSMFIPCDTDGNPMAEQEKQYQKALDAVLFEGWRIAPYGPDNFRHLSLGYGPARRPLAIYVRHYPQAFR